jgi:hypothetical protein
MSKEKSIVDIMFKYGFEPEPCRGTEAYVKLERPGDESYCIIVTSERNSDKPDSLDEPVCVDVYSGELCDRELQPTKRYDSLKEYLATLDE